MKAKRWLSVLLTLVMVLSLLPVGVLAAQPTADDPVLGYNGYEHKPEHIVGRIEDETGTMEPIYWSDEVPAGCPFEESEYEGIVFTGQYANYTDADTWYPSWAEDGNMYSQWTDGNIGSDPCWSMGTTARTGQARIEGDDPMNLRIVNLGSMEQSAAPAGGRYPCGNLVYNGTWYNGSYLLTNPGPEDEGCDIYNWSQIEGFMGFRTATMQDRDTTEPITQQDYPWNQYIHEWDEAANLDTNGEAIWVTENPDGSNPLFGEKHDITGEIRFGAPHFVDFGQNMEYAPVVNGEKKAYLVGHGSMQYGAFNSWVQGDAAFLARVTPDPETINDMESWEFYAGRDARGNEIWSKNLDDAEPIAQWDSHMGNVAITYNAPLDKYFMTYSRGINMQRYDTVIMEADELTGPYKMVHYLENFGPVAYFTNIPSKFISDDGKTMWLCYSGNFYNQASGYPDHSEYAMCLREFRLVSEGDEVPEQDPPFVYGENTPNPDSTVPDGATNLALTATPSGSSTYEGYDVAGICDGNLGGYGATGDLEANIAYEWATKGEGVGTWAKLEWAEPQTVASVRLFDRPNTQDQILQGTLEFSDGTTIKVESLPDDGKTGRAVNLETPLDNITWVKFTVDAVGAWMNIGLSEFEVYDKALEIAELPADANLAGSATITTSSTMQGYPEASGINDGKADGWPRNTSLEWRSDGETSGAWVELNWDEPQTVSALEVHQNRKRGERIAAAHLVFNNDPSDTLSVDNAFTDSETATISFAPRTDVTSLRLVVDAVQSGDENVGITEIYVYSDYDLDIQPTEGIVEAETAQLQNADLVSAADASAGYAVQMKQAGSQITFTATESWDTLAVCYRAEMDASCTLQINDGPETAITLLQTGGNSWKQMSLGVPVAEGDVVTLTMPKAAGPVQVDYFHPYQEEEEGQNIALGCPVQAASMTGYPASNAVDGNGSTFWNSQGVASEETPAEFVVDFQDVYQITNVCVQLPESWTDCRTQKIALYAGTEEGQYEQIAAAQEYTFNAIAGDPENNQNRVQLSVTEPFEAQYLKVVVYSNNLGKNAQIGELEVYGTLAGEESENRNLAKNRPVEGSAKASYGQEISVIVDGQQGTQVGMGFWASAQAPGWASVDLGQSYRVNRLVLMVPSDWPEPREQNIEILTSQDGVHYETAVAATPYMFDPTENGNGNQVEIVLPEATVARYVKVQIEWNHWWEPEDPRDEEHLTVVEPQLSELEVYGEALPEVTGITLNPETLTLKAWETSAPIQAVIEPEAAEGSSLSWSSDDISVATVDGNGVVQARGDGTCRIRVRAIGSGAEAYCAVTVEENAITGVTPLPQKNVDKGTAAEDLRLPAKVQVQLETGTADLHVGQWSCENYDPQTTGTYTFTAPLQLLPGMTNADDLAATIVVAVRSEDAPAVEITGRNAEGFVNQKDLQAEITLNVGQEVLFTDLLHDGEILDTYEGTKISVPEFADTYGDGAYVLRVYTAEQEYHDYDFTLDCTAPEITITGNQTGSDFYGDVTVKVADNWLSQVKINDTVYETTAELPVLSDLGAYLVTATDKAGNETQVTFNITAEPSHGGGSTTSRYTITVTQATGGKISPSTTSVTKGADKTFTITASEGYKISDVLVDGKSVGAVSTYTFKNVRARHTITAKFEKVEDITNVGGFIDVKSNDWYADAVQYVVDEGLMNGTSETTFSPSGATTRGMIVTILYRQAGSPKVESDKATWWSDARVWAMENSVSDGTNMDKEITREQLATMLYRYAELQGEDISKTTSLGGFKDGDKVSAYAVDALKWAAAEGIVTGKTGNIIDSQAGATRAETATMLMRFCKGSK